nr:ORF6N domain-containing protein [Fibrobacter succinogenes]
MLDADLAEIYGYETKAFNQQVKNNIEKFDEDFRFQLTKNENFEILRCKKGMRTNSWTQLEAGASICPMYLRNRA